MRLVKKVGREWKVHAVLFRLYPTGNGKSVEVSKPGNSVVRQANISVRWQPVCVCVCVCVCVGDDAWS